MHKVFIFILLILTDTLQLIWSPNTEDDMLRYRIYRSIGNFESFRLIDSVEHPDTTYFDFDSIEYNDKSYAYYLRAVNQSMLYSNPSDTVWIVLNSDTSLPVVVTHFNGVYLDGYVHLWWKAESEVDMYGYNIYKGVGLSDSVLLNTHIIPAHNQQFEIDYEYNDYDVVNDSLYHYTLESVGLDGEKETHGTIHVSSYNTDVLKPVDHVGKFDYYPNPTTSEFIIAVEVDRVSNVDIDIFNLIGSKVYTMDTQIARVGLNYIPLKVRGLSSGTYYFRVKIRDSVYNGKLLIIH